MAVGEIGTGIEGTGEIEAEIAEDVIVVVETDVVRLRRFLRSKHEPMSLGRMRDLTAHWKSSLAKF
jgi:hypothetical protein